ncbi:hypothetical protein [Winogradskyella sp. KYW1333]|uniref:hypothetical protein n=1 Tax=Winogradskyella sp. KYW1333 TaxID=2282123 RepID=UPI000DF35A67|nr:hypothetical protein [Winogradskyella sp. KYW1333]RCT55067.1 hypothetical protein DUZ96_04805 [Winogradskyella sp. KYW1333]
MDELELLKKDWKKEQLEFNTFADSEIYSMLHKKSSSIIKTLFYISIAEFAFWILVNTLPYFLSDSYEEKLEASYENPLFVGLSFLSFGVIILFIYLLYNSYKSISITDNAKKLMESILRTRKVIKYYVIFNLVMIFISIPLSLYFEFNQNPEFHERVASMDSGQMLVLYLITTLVTGVIILIFWLIYRLIYGILLKRLNRNYDELKKLEV